MTKVTAKTKPSNQERHVHKDPAARLAQDLPTPSALPYPDTAALEPTPSPAQGIKMGRSRDH